MNRSLLRTYSLTVCVLTSFCVLLIAGIPLWHGLIHSAEAIEDHDLYQFYNQAQNTCNNCQPDQPLVLASAAPIAIQQFKADIQPVVAAPSLLEPPGWIPQWVFMSLRVVIGLIGMLIVAVHWRLYKNLGYVQ